MQQLRNLIVCLTHLLGRRWSLAFGSFALLVVGLILTAASVEARALDTTSIRQQGDTTLSATVSTTAHYTRTFPWTISKSVTPSSWNLFTGDSATSKYTITVTKGNGVDAIWYEGQVCVTNGGAAPTENLAIVAELSRPPSGSPVIASTNVDVSSNPIIPANTGPYCYNYRIDVVPTTLLTPGATYKVTANVTITNHAGHSGEPFGPSPSTTAVLPTNPTLVNDTIHVNDTNGQSFTFSTSGSQTYDKTFTCDNGGDNPNTATISETGQSASASVKITCYSLEVSKTAKASFTRTYNWNIQKTANPTSLTLQIGETATVNYMATVNATFTDSNYAASGTITIHNPAPISATINNVSDSVSGVGSITPTCGVTFPYTLVAGGDLTCNYTATLPDNSTRTNTATATLQNYNYASDGSGTADGTTDFSGTASIDFSTATITEVDKTITVTDTLGGSLGTVTYGVGTLPKTFAYSITVGPFTSCGTRFITNTATFTTNNTGATGSASQTVTVNVPCAGGCTLTIGYWKNHPTQTGKLLPIWLGTPNGLKSVSVTSAGQATAIFNFNGDASNGINKLYAQLLAARLNIKSGADPSTVASTISAADTFLATHNSGDWASLSRSDKNTVIGWATVLDSYNNGLIGPGHCTE